MKRTFANPPNWTRIIEKSFSFGDIMASNIFYGE